MVKNIFTAQGKKASIGVFLLALSACASTSETMETPSPTPPSFTLTAGPEQIFDTPDQAADSLAEASRRGDRQKLLAILGPEGRQIISSGDKVADKQARFQFLAAYDKAHKIEDDGNKKLLVIGDQEWPLPIPLIEVVNKDGRDGWQFDTESGQQEILNRRIGRNELDVIKTSRAFVVAEREYAATHKAPNGRPEYAQRFISHEGSEDGLYWKVKPGQPESPFGPLIAHAQQETYSVGKSQPTKSVPYHGYYYKVLTQQGQNAAGNTLDYIVNGHMVNGFAMIAYPAIYGNSGIMTFIVNQSGIVFESNLGPSTAEHVKQITSYDPNENWKIAKDK